MKKAVPLLLFIVAWIIPQTVFAGTSSVPAIKIMLDRNELVSDVAPRIENDRTLVPIRVISENLGAEVGWDDVNRKVTVTKADLTLVLTIGSTLVVNNGETIEIDVAPQIYDDRTFVPLRFISEYIGLNVDWDNDTRTVLLETPPPPEPPPAETASDQGSENQANPIEPIPTGVVNGIIVDSDAIIISTTLENPEVSILYLDSPRRAVIDIVYTKPELTESVIPQNSPLFQQVRYSYFNNTPDTTRIVLDLADRVDAKVEIRGSEVFIQFTPYIYKIVLDAGHGGKDPGGISVSGKYEKNFALDMVLRVVELLKTNARIEVLTTRSDDSYPTLEERIAFANDTKADLFLSIHANKYKTTSRGMETYYSRKDSIKFATLLHQVVLPITGFLDRHVKQADFKVIHYTTMPAALLEVGFLSNPEEEKILFDPDFRQKVAQGIADALVQYLEIPATNEVKQ